MSFTPFVPLEGAPGALSTSAANALPRIKRDDIHGSVATTLGRGANGVVYAARWESGNQAVAVKELNRLRLDPGASMLLMEEAALMNRLRHDHVVRLWGIIDDTLTGTVSIVMELLDFNLDQWARSTCGVTASTVELLYALASVATAVEYLHTLPDPILHRDLKPTNILYSRKDGRPKLADFGWSALLRALCTRNSTAAAEAGTIAFTAPELLASVSATLNNSMPPVATTKSDVFSFALTMWSILARTVPYEAFMATPGAAGATQVQRLAQHVLAGGRPSMDTLRACSAVPAGITALIERAWHADPLERPSMGVIVTEMHACLAQAGLGARFSLPHWNAMAVPFASRLMDALGTSSAPPNGSLVHALHEMRTNQRGGNLSVVACSEVVSEAAVRASVATFAQQVRQADKFSQGVFLIDIQDVRDSVSEIAAWMQLDVPLANENDPVWLSAAIAIRLQVMTDWLVVLYNLGQLATCPYAHLLHDLLPDTVHGTIIGILKDSASFADVTAWRPHARFLSISSANILSADDATGPPVSIAIGMESVAADMPSSAGDGGDITLALLDVNPSWIESSQRVHYAISSAAVSSSQLARASATRSGNPTYGDARSSPRIIDEDMLQVGDVRLLQRIRASTLGQPAHFRVALPAFKEHKLLEHYESIAVGQHAFTSEHATWVRAHAQLLRSLGHPNIVVCYGYVSQHAALPHGISLVMELLSQPVRHVCAVAHVHEVLFALTAVTDAVAALHSRIPAIVHGNIHPDIIMLDMFGVAKLCGFAFAQQEGARTPVASSGLLRKLTEVTRTLHAPFVAPELVEYAAPTRASDVFSVASTVAACLAMQRSTAAAHDFREPESISTITGALTASGCALDIATSLGACIHQSLSAEPSDRPAARQLGFLLRAAHASVAQAYAQRHAPLAVVPVRVELLRAPFPSQLAFPAAAVGDTFMRVADAVKKLRMALLPHPGPLQKAVSAPEPQSRTNVELQLTAPSSGVRRLISTDSSLPPAAMQAPSVSATYRNVVALMGQSGVGKSTAISRYCYWTRSQDVALCAGGIFYVNLSSFDTVLAHVRSFVAALQLDVPTTSSILSLAEHVNKELMTRRQDWLVVLDNFDDLGILDAQVFNARDTSASTDSSSEVSMRHVIDLLAPVCDRGFVLVSSRASENAITEWRHEALIVRVGTLRDEEAVEALIRHAAVATPDEDALSALVACVFSPAAYSVNSVVYAELWRRALGAPLGASLPADLNAREECAAIRMLACDLMQRLPAAITLVGATMRRSAGTSTPCSFSTYASQMQAAGVNTVEAEEAENGKRMLRRWLEHVHLERLLQPLLDADLTDTDLLQRVGVEELRLCLGSDADVETLIMARRLHRPPVYSAKLVTPAFRYALRSLVPVVGVASSAGGVEAVAATAKGGRLADTNEYTSAEVLLLALAVIAPDAVPRELTWALAMSVSHSCNLSETRMRAVLEALTQLHVLSTVDDGTTSMHRLFHGAAWMTLRKGADVSRHAAVAVEHAFRSLTAGKHNTLTDRAAMDAQLLLVHARTRLTAGSRFHQLLTENASRLDSALTSPLPRLLCVVQLDAAWLAYRVGRHEIVAVAANEVLEHCRAADETQSAPLIAEALDVRASSEHATYNYAAAIATNRSLLLHLEGTHGDAVHRASCMQRTANSLRQLDMRGEAIALHERALTLMRTEWDAGRATALDMTFVLTGYASTLLSSAREQEGLLLNRDAMHFMRLAQPNGASPTYMKMLVELSISISSQREEVLTPELLQEALDCSVEARQIAATQLNPYHIKVAYAMRSQASVLRRLRRFEECHRVCEEALLVHAVLDIEGLNWHEKVAILYEYSKALIGVNRASEGRVAAVQARDILLKRLGPNAARHPHVAGIQMQEATALEAMGHTDEALRLYRDAEAVMKRAYSADAEPQELQYVRARIAALSVDRSFVADGEE